MSIHAYTLKYFGYLLHSLKAKLQVLRMSASTRLLRDKYWIENTVKVCNLSSAMNFHKKLGISEMTPLACIGKFI
jgi:hypothetical protein